MTSAAKKPRSKNGRREREEGRVDSACSPAACRHEDIPIARVIANRWQPRDLFEESELRSLGETMKAVGQLQPILVRPNADGPNADGYELLAGERRLRAAQLVGMKTIYATIRDASDADARKISIIENDQRVGLTAIERARAYQQMLDNGDAEGPTDLAKQLRIEPSTVSNLLRLLKLPDAWQQRIVSREISERHGRALLRFLDYPPILDAFAEILDESIKADGEAPSVSEWERAIIPEVIRKHGRATLGPMNNGSIYDQQYGRLTVFEPLPWQMRSLDVIDVAGTPYALNSELWDQLQAEHVEELLAERRKAAEEIEADGREGDLQEESPEPAVPAGTDDSSDAAGDNDEASEADRRGDSDDADLASPEPPAPDRRQANGKDFESRLWAWKSMFLRHAVAAQLQDRASEGEILKLACLAITCWNHDTHEDELLAICQKVAGGRRKKDAIAALTEFHDLDTSRVAGRLLASMFWTEEAGPVLGIDADEVVDIAAMLGVDLAEAWAAGDVPEPAGYWNLHTKEQLLAIAKEVKAADWLPNQHGEPTTAAELAKMTRAELIDNLVGAVATNDSTEAGIPIPKEILRAKPPRT